MSKIVDGVVECVRPIVESNNMELVEVEEKMLYGDKNIFIYIDKEGGITLDDCELIHNAISEPLDAFDATLGQNYVVNVSSPGLDRPFKRDKDFLKNVGNDVEVSLYKPIENLKKFEGKLLSFDGEQVEVEVGKNTIKLNLKDIALMRAVIKF